MNRTAFITLVAAAGFAASANADEVRFQRSLASGHSAAITFGTLDDARNPEETVPLGLSIRIENTISNDFDTLEDRVLTGIFWDMGGVSIEQYINQDLGDNGWGAFGGPVEYGEYDGPQRRDAPDILEFWAFREGLSNDEVFVPDDFNSPDFGLGAESFGVFEDWDIINYNDDYYTDQLDGLDGGVLSPTGDSPDNGGPGLVDGNDFPLWRGFIEFQIFLEPEFFDLFELSDIADVSFQFDDSFDDTSIPANAVIPLPSAAGMGLAGLALLASRRRR
jgi:hypothetical protein